MIVELPQPGNPPDLSYLTQEEILFFLVCFEGRRRGVLGPKIADLPPAVWERMRKVLAKAPAFKADEVQP